MGIAESILNVLQKMELDTPTPIQRKSIPVALNGEDIIGIAQTGTGKTFAFGIPMIQRLALYRGRGLIMAPTRELAQQIEENLKKLGSALGLRTATLIGGEPIGKQIIQLRNKPHVIIATPGRLIDHLKRNYVKLDDIKILVLDEADLMFDMGFAPQIEAVLKNISKSRQTMLFSATMPPEVIKLTANHMSTPVNIEVAPTGTTAENVDQEIFVMKQEDKPKHLEKILKDYTGSVLIFARTKHKVKRLTESVKLMGHRATEMHSDRSLGQRREALEGFKTHAYRIMVATDIAARGIDVNGIELIINYDLPEKSNDYVHRIGRTGRAGKKGKAISFAMPSQGREIRNIEQLININLAKTKFADLAHTKVYSSYRKHGRSPRSVAVKRSQNNFRNFKSAKPQSSVTKKKNYGPKRRLDRTGFFSTDKQRYRASMRIGR